LGNSYIPIVVALIGLLGIIYRMRKRKEIRLLDNRIPVLQDAKLRFEIMKGYLIQDLPGNTNKYIHDSKNWFIEKENLLSKKIMCFWVEIQKESISWVNNIDRLKQEQREKEHAEIAMLVSNSEIRIQRLIEKTISEIAKEFKK